MADDGKKYVCFIKRRAGAEFLPCEHEGGELVVKPLCEFIGHEISRWLDPSVFMKVNREVFFADVDNHVVNSKFAAMLGWNYAAAARLVETEGVVYLLVAHPKFEAKPFSFRQVRDDDAYALKMIETIWSIRGGEIVFQEYDPVIHFAGCKLQR